MLKPSSLMADVAASPLGSGEYPGQTSGDHLPGGVTVARVALDHLVKVRILTGQFWGSFSTRYDAQCLAKPGKSQVLRR